MMKNKRIAAAATAAVMAGTMLTSCSQPNLENLLPFNEESKVKEYSSVVEGSALTIYVDANAKDGGDGTESAPFKTIPEAQAKIRELKAGEGLPTGGITVLVKDGEYRITEGLVFTEEDSGTEECPITYVSESEFGAKITGSVLISTSDCEPINEEEISRLMDKSAAENIVKIDLTKYGLTKEDWGTIKYYGYANAHDRYDPTDEVGGEFEADFFVGDTRLMLARWPNEEFIILDDMIVEFGDNRQNPGFYEFETMRNPDGPTIGIIGSVANRISQWSDPSTVWTSGYICHVYAYSKNKVEYFDLENKAVKLKYAEEWLCPDTVTSRDIRSYYFINIFDELDYPGEYYLDRENGIMYICKTAGFDSEKIKMPVISDDIITLQNVSYVTFKGLCIGETKGNGVVGSSNDFVIDNCKILNLNGAGASLSGNRITIKNSEICNLGSRGITLSGGNSGNLISSENLIYNNYIHDFGQIEKTYHAGVLVSGCGVTVANNELAFAPHMAVEWSGPNHIFEYNDIHDVCLEASDCGACYQGRNMSSYGCVFRYNFIHDIGRGTAFAQGLYFDDGLAGQTAYGNILMNITGQAIQLGGGRDHVIENNIIINAMVNPIQYDERVRLGIKQIDNWLINYSSMTNSLISQKQNSAWLEAFPIMEKIIPYTEDYIANYDDPYFEANPAHSIIKNNIVYTLRESNIDNRVPSIKNDIRESAARFSYVEDCYVIKGYNYISDFPNWHNGDYTMKEDSKAKELCPDFEIIPFDKIGRIK